jgi:hypothetical protein
LKLRYTLRGAAELDQVLDYIETQSPQGAHHVQARIKVIHQGHHRVAIAASTRRAAHQ